jgi:hypothetical protein
MRIKKLKILKNQIRFEIYNLLKSSKSTARNPNRTTPRRFAKFLIDQEIYDHFKSVYKIKGIYSTSDCLLDKLGLRSAKRFSKKPQGSNLVECRFKTFFYAVESTWRFMIRKRTIDVEMEPGHSEKITKFVFSIKFVCDTQVISNQ